MYRLITYLLTLVSCSILSCKTTTDNARISTDTYEDLITVFQEPPIEYSTGPFWVWNDEVTREKIDRQLQYFKNEHIHQVFIHPRPGLISEYLSEEWFELCRYTLDKAEELDMNIWLYDENSFPSGFGGGHVQAEMPESYTRGIALSMIKTNKLEEDQLPEYQVILKKEGDKFIDITGGVNDEYGQEGNYYIFELVHGEKSGWFGGFAYVDLLYEGVTEKFIEVTMEGYEEYMGEEFGGRIPGIFTDEPNIAPRGSQNSIRWTPALFDAFNDRWGYDLRVNLASLFEETGNWRKVRHNYYGLLLEMFIEKWSKPWYEYTEKNNLKWTGHYWEHGWPSPYHGGDNMAMYAWHQYPGIDMLFNNYQERPDQFGNVRAVRELGSVVNQLGKERALSETYGAAGWELSFEDMKRLGDWEYTLGVNFMNQHLAYMTLKGRRKGDFPQSIFYHAPYWEHYDVLADYFARLSAGLSKGEQVNNTLVIEPTTSAWMYYTPTGNNPAMEEIGHEFEDFLHTMEKYQLEYDLASENIMKDHAEIVERKFVIGERSYDLVILPPGFESMDKATFELIRRYIASGGRIISLELPQYIDGEETSDFRSLSNNYSELWAQVDNITDAEILAELKETDFSVNSPEDINGKVYHMRRIFQDGQLFFWSNFNQEDHASVIFEAKGKSVTRLDAFTGQTNPFPFELNENQVRIGFTLAPAESILLFVHNETTGVQEALIENHKNEQVVMSDSSAMVREAPNVLTIDYLDLTIDSQRFENIYYSMAADSAYKLNGLDIYRYDYNPWSVAIQYKTNILDMNDSFDENSGFEAGYKFELSGEFIPTSLKAVVEWPHLYDVYINDRTIEPADDEWWLDHSFGVFDIAAYLQPGQNELRLVIQPMHIHAEIEPVYLLGEFGVQDTDKGFVLIPPKNLHYGSWKDQNMPFYGHGVTYLKTITAAENSHYKVKLNDWNGTVAEVIVNGESAGIIGWQPYELDISGNIVPGENKVEVKVIGSLKNVLGPHHNNPRKGIVTPWSFFFAPDQQPPGQAYDLDDYGLLEEFDIIAFEL